MRRPAEQRERLRAEAAAHYRAGASIRDIAVSLGHSYKGIRAVPLNAGITLRGVGGNRRTSTEGRPRGDSSRDDVEVPAAITSPARPRTSQIYPPIHPWSLVRS